MGAPVLGTLVLLIFGARTAYVMTSRTIISFVAAINVVLKLVAVGLLARTDQVKSRLQLSFCLVPMTVAYLVSVVSGGSA